MISIPIGTDKLAAVQLHLQLSRAYPRQQVSKATLTDDPIGDNETC